MYFGYTNSRAAKQDRKYLIPNPSPEKGFYYRSNHFPFAKNGIPSLYVGGGVDVIGKVATLNGLPIKSLNAGDVFFKTLAYRSELYALGYRKAFRLMQEE